MSFPPPPLGGPPPLPPPLLNGPPMGAPTSLLGGPPPPQLPPPPGAPGTIPPMLLGALPPGVPLSLSGTAPPSIASQPISYPSMPPPPPGLPPGIPSLMALQPDGCTIVGAPPHTGVQDPYFNAPVTTVFVGNISDKVADNVVRQFLMHCGTVLNWKRVQGATGKLQGFGFCEYREPEATLRALRVLNGLGVGDKALLVRVDSKTRKQLDEYMLEKNGIKIPESEDDKKAEDHVDDVSLTEDRRVKSMIASLIGDNVIPGSADDIAKSVEESMLHVAKQKGLVEKDGGFDDIRMDESEKRIVTDEIRKFRDAYDKDVPAEVTKRSGDRERERKRSSRSRSPSRNRDRDRGEHRERKRGREELSYEDWEAQRKERAAKRREEALKKRIRDWEERERRKKRQYERDENKDKERVEIQAKEKRKLGRFMEKYDDNRNDKKYFGGKDWSHLKRDREEEIREDDRDRRREEEEIEAEKRRKEEEERKAQEARVTLAQPIKVMAKPKEEKPKLVPPGAKPEPPPVELIKEEEPQSPTSEQPAIVGDGKPHLLGAEYVAAQVRRQKELEEFVEAGGKATVETAFNDRSEEETAAAITMAMKKKLVPLEYTEEEQRAVGRTNIPLADKKKRSIRALIDHIPTSKEDLFAYKVDWSTVDEALVETKVKPWVNKKIVEYIGEEEPTLVSFICEKVLKHMPAENILRDVDVVLDEEAELFVTKLWRLLIFETESKLLGLVKKPKSSS